MIDHLDKKTQTLPLEQKRGRGRPATGQPLSNAERQRRYREAQKAQRNENMHKEVAEDLRAELAKALERIEELEAESRKRRKTIVEQARMIQEAEAKLAQRNEKTEKAYVCAMQKKSPKGQWRTACKYENHMEGNIEYLEVCEGEMGHLYRLINLK